MPTYDYTCDACHHEFELFQSITAQPEKKCPKCKKNKLRRLFGAGAGIMFKGSGFYQTDYRSDSYKKAAEADKPKTDAAASTADTTSAKTDSKPAKSETKATAKSEKPKKT